MDQEITVVDLIFTTLVMLKGEEFTDFCYYKFSVDWWTQRLSISRN